MLETVRKPNTFYGSLQYGLIISREGLTKDVYDYYWNSHSRGTDGIGNDVSSNVNYSNPYLDGYNQKRSKSIFDPCPYGFRVPVNGTYNRFVNFGWKQNSYTAGFRYELYWFAILGRRFRESGIFNYIGYYSGFYTSSVNSETTVYLVNHYPNGSSILSSSITMTDAFSVRCIEDAKKEV